MLQFEWICGKGLRIVVGRLIGQNVIRSHWLTDNVMFIDPINCHNMIDRGFIHLIPGATTLWMNQEHGDQ